MTLPRLAPMLATAWPAAFDDPDWWFEVKWDGYRVLAESRDGGVRLVSRRGVDLTGSFPEVARLDLPDGAVLDGEVVVFDEAGLPSFHALQQRSGLAGRTASEQGARRPATLIAFDLLRLGGVDLVDLPVEERRRRLAALDVPGVVVPEPVRADGTALWRAVRERGLEGMVAKRAASPYRPGRRSPDWRKIAHRRSSRFVVGGFLPGGRSATFGSLLLGLRAEGLRFVGAVGSGFDDRGLREAKTALEGIVRASSPFLPSPALPRQAVWVEPLLVTVVEFKEWTPEGRLRAPVFKGWDAIDPSEATWEREGPPASGGPTG